jgi:hypothetical protein
MHLKRIVIAAAVCASLGASSAPVGASPSRAAIALATTSWVDKPGDLRLSPTDRGPAVTGVCPTSALYHPNEPPIVYVHVKVQNAAVWWQAPSPAIPYKTAFLAFDMGTPTWTSPGAALPNIAPMQSVYVDLPFYGILGSVDTKVPRHLMVIVNPVPSIPESDSADEHNNTITLYFKFPAPCGPNWLTAPNGAAYPVRNIIPLQLLRATPTPVPKHKP